MRKALISLGIAIALLVGIFGCGDDVGPGPGSFKTIVLHPSILPTLKAGLIYEGWVMKDTLWHEYQSFGRFFWDEYDFRFLSETDLTKDIGSKFTINGNVYDYNYIAITLEAVTNDDPAPSPTIVAFSRVQRDISTEMRFPLSNIMTGEYAIGTFSDGHFKEKGESRTNEYYGIWFIDLIHGAGANDTIESYDRGLSLPPLPDTGYTYEGWVSTNLGDTLSSGKFVSPQYYDYDNTHCLQDAIPNFPGEDFLINKPDRVPADHWPLDLYVGGQVFITIEPNPDNDLTRPSQLVILKQNLLTDTATARGRSEGMANSTENSYPKIHVDFQN